MNEIIDESVLIQYDTELSEEAPPNATDENGYLLNYLPDNTKVRLTRVMEEVTPHLTQNQIIILAKSLGKVFNNTECVPCKIAGNPTKQNKFLIDEFIKSKKVEGRSTHTLYVYKRDLIALSKFLQERGVSLINMEAQDMRDYLQMKMDTGSNATTCDNYRRNASSFFRWARREHYTSFSPVDAVAPVKRVKKIKKSFSQLDLLKLREACRCTRDRAIMELFLSSGIRVRELHNMKIEDVDFHNNEFIVLGKGNKERVCYFNEVTHTWIRRWLDERGQDDCPYLWIGLKIRHGKHVQFGIHGIERMIRDTGRIAGVPDTHPHRFRHTFATTALNKGIPIEQVQQLLGHERLDTTMIYAKVARDDVKHNHRKLMN